MSTGGSHPSIPLDEFLRVAAGVTGVTLTASTALLLDWSLDSLSTDEWTRLLKIDQELSPGSINIERADQFFARLRVFGGGYALLALGLGCIAAAITWLAHPQIDTTREIVLMGTASLSAFFFVTIKMMTKRLMSAFVPLILFAIFLLLAFGGPLLSRTLGLT